jgi:microcystin-dependent protein
MPTTPVLLLPYPNESDPADVPADVQKLATQIEAVRGAANGLASLDASSKIPAAQIPSGAYVPTSAIGQPNGVAGLDANGKVPASQLPTVAMPGEIRLWPGSTVPALASYGHWVWADGAIYVSATYPLAAANIATAWRTAYGAADPGAGNFRVPDLRGVVPIGLDQMPGVGSTRANRITRAAAAVLAAFTGEETHKLVTAEMPAHGHPISGNGGVSGGAALIRTTSDGAGGTVAGLVQSAGGDGVHENLPPAVFVPYIVKLDD